MGAIFFILVAIFGFSVESIKIRATRRQWIQYTPPALNTVIPTQAQYYDYNQYYHQRIPIYKNGRLVHSYIDPLPSRYYTYGYGANKYAGLQPYQANPEMTNGGQMYQSGYQTWPGASVEQGGVNGYEGISQAGYKNWRNSFGNPTFHKSWQNYGGRHDLNLAIARDAHSDDNEQNDYAFDKNALNTDEINHSVDHNLSNAENRDQGSHADSNIVDQENQAGSVDFRSSVVDNEQSDALYSAAVDTDLSNNENVYSGDQNNLDIASIGSLPHEVNIHDEVNTNSINAQAENDLVSQDNSGILNEDSKHDWQEKPPTTDTKEINVLPFSVEPEDMISQRNRDVSIDAIDTETGSKIDAGTENEENVSENDLILGNSDDTLSLDRSGFDNTGRSQIFNSVPIDHVNRNILISPTPYTNSYGIYFNRENTLLPVTMEKREKITEYPYVYPYNLQRNEQLNSYRKPWREVYPIRELRYNNRYYVTPRNYNIDVIEPVHKSKLSELSDLVNKFVLNICPNPDVVPQVEKIPGINRLDTLLKILRMFGIREIPQNLYENIRSPHLVEKRLLNFDYADDALNPRYNRRIPVSQNSLHHIDVEPNRPLPGVSPYLRKPYIAPNEVNILTENLRSDENTENHEDVNDDESIIPEFRMFKDHHVADNDLDDVDHTPDSIQPTNYDEADMISEYTPEPHDPLLIKEEFINMMTEAITPDLVKLYHSKCYKEKTEKLVLGIKALIESLESEQCEVEENITEEEI